MGFRRSRQSNFQIGSTGFSSTIRRGTTFRADSDGLKVSLDDLKQYRTYLNSLVEEGERMMHEVAQVWDDEIHESYQHVWQQIRQKLSQFGEELGPVCSYVERKIQEIEQSENSHM